MKYLSVTHEKEIRLDHFFAIISSRFFFSFTNISELPKTTTIRCKTIQLQKKIKLRQLQRKQNSHALAIACWAFAMSSVAAMGDQAENKRKVETQVPKLPALLACNALALASELHTGPLAEGPLCTATAAASLQTTQQSKGYHLAKGVRNSTMFFFNYLGGPSSYFVPVANSQLRFFSVWTHRIVNLPSF